MSVCKGVPKPCEARCVARIDEDSRQTLAL